MPSSRYSTKLLPDRTLPVHFYNTHTQIQTHLAIKMEILILLIITYIKNCFKKNNNHKISQSTEWQCDLSQCCYLLIHKIIYHSTHYCLLLLMHVCIHSCNNHIPPTCCLISSPGKTQAWRMSMLWTQPYKNNDTILYEHNLKIMASLLSTTQL